MFDEVRICALGSIDEAVLELHPGLTVLSGETGAGKSSVVKAFGLLAGGRADARQHSQRPHELRSGGSPHGRPGRSRGRSRPRSGRRGGGLDAAGGPHGVRRRSLAGLRWRAVRSRPACSRSLLAGCSPCTARAASSSCAPGRPARHARPFRRPARARAAGGLPRCPRALDNVRGVSRPSSARSRVSACGRSSCCDWASPRSSGLRRCRARISLSTVSLTGLGAADELRCASEVARAALAGDAEDAGSADGGAVTALAFAARALDGAADSDPELRGLGAAGSRDRCADRRIVRRAGLLRRGGRRRSAAPLRGAGAAGRAQPALPPPRHRCRRGAGLGGRCRPSSVGVGRRWCARIRAGSDRAAGGRGDAGAREAAERGPRYGGRQSAAPGDGRAGRPVDDLCPIRSWR